jgi:Arc/MetJ family transcription regulator
MEFDIRIEKELVEQLLRNYLRKRFTDEEIVEIREEQENFDYDDFRFDGFTVKMKLD